MSVAFKWRRNEITCRLRQRDKNHDGYREPETCEADQVLVGVMIFIVCVVFHGNVSGHKQNLYSLRNRHYQALEIRKRAAMSNRSNTVRTINRGR